MHFLPVFELMSDSLTTIQVEPHQCPLQPVHMRYHLFLQYGWFLQNLGKDFIRTNMHTTVSILFFHFLYLQRNIHGWIVFICFGSWKPSSMYHCIWRRSIHTTKTRQTTKFLLYLLLHCYKCWHADNWLHLTSFKVITLLYFWLSCLIFYNSLDQIYWTKSIGPNSLDKLD